MDQINIGKYIILTTTNIRKLYHSYGDGSCNHLISDLSPTGFHVLRYSRAVGNKSIHTSWIACLKKGSDFISEHINDVPSAILEFNCDIYAFNHFAVTLSESYDPSLSSTKIIRDSDVYNWN